jgi:hypothetical protein
VQNSAGFDFFLMHEAHLIDFIMQYKKMKGGKFEGVVAR